GENLAARPLTGDELVPDPNYSSTRAISIAAPPAQVWQWLVQIGYGRGGFYSYDQLERMAGLTGLHSTNEIVPEWQALKAGETVSISPITPLQVA
ncbi:hypothetical protein P7A58_15550, partial [Clostridium perfringens]|nr:hypothetical protein [Clostridium perfringens]